MKSILLSFALISVSVTGANANSVPECMVHAKTLQNPSALAGAAQVCMTVYFDSLRTEAEACRAHAEKKTLPGAEFAACQATLILGLRDQIDTCHREASNLYREGDELTARVSGGAKSGCFGLSEQATKLCRDNAEKFSGLAEAAAEGACEAAGL